MAITPSIFGDPEGVEYAFVQPLRGWLTLVARGIP
jgi:hypothetical protein